MGLDEHFGAIGRVLERVGDDVGEQLAQTVLVALHADVVGHPHVDDVAVSAVRDLQRLHGVVDEVVEIEPFDLKARGPGLHARQVQQERDEIGEPVRLVQDAFQIRRCRLHDAVRHVLHHGLQRGDGGSQLMADVGDHIPPHLVGMLQLLGHLVEGARQLAHLVVAVCPGFDPDRVVAVGHGLGGVRHLPQRRGQAPGEEIGDAERHDERQRHRDPPAPAEFEQEPCHDERDGGGEDDDDGQFGFQGVQQTNGPFRVQNGPERLLGGMRGVHSCRSGGSNA